MDLQLGQYARDHKISKRDGEDGRGDAVLNNDLCQYVSYVLLI
jgi:hypothetical protein